MKRDDGVNAWLAARIDGQLEDEDVEDQPTELGDRAARAALEEEIEDPTTVSADPEGSLEGEEDPRTVRIRRMPLAFIGESVIDPTTVQHDSEEATRWRAQASVDEVPLLRHSPTPVHRAPPLPVVVSAPAAPEAETTNWPALAGTALVGGGLGLLVVLLWGWWML